MKTYTHAGVSTLNGVVKLRLANDAARVKTLEKNGHTGIELIELVIPMSNIEAAEYLLDNGFQYDVPSSVAAITLARDNAQSKIDKANRAAEAGEPVADEIEDLEEA